MRRSYLSVVLFVVFALVFTVAPSLRLRPPAEKQAAKRSGALNAPTKSAA